MWRAAALLSLWVSAAQGQQIAKLTADDAAEGDYFGTSVSISGDTVLVGAKWGGGTVEYSGSAYVFREVGGAWQQTAELTAGDGAYGDRFGYSVSLDGDTALIGAYTSDVRGTDSGSAYLFRYSGGAWQQIAELIGDDTRSENNFGATVSISGDTAAIGTGVWGSASAVYIFRELQGIWSQVAKFEVGDGFGSSVEIRGDTVIVGAVNEGPAGAAYVFREVGGVWQQLARLIAGDAGEGDLFGLRVSIHGGTALVGATGRDDAGENSGAAYLFRETGGVWQELAKLTADDGVEGARFGGGVSLAGNTAAIGASLDVIGGWHRGSVYVFRESGGVWQQIDKLTADDGVGYDYFGLGVKVQADTVLVGSSFDDDAGSQSGSAYLFKIAPSCPADFNGDGSVNTLDVLGFLNAWAAGDASADFNGDGTVNTLDVLAFLNAWAAGC